MKAVMVVPTYWGRGKEEGWKEQDAVYDHPTPLDQEGTLGRFLQSTAKLENKDFSLVIIAVATASDMELEVEKKALHILNSFKPEMPTYLFSHLQIKKLNKKLEARGVRDFEQLLNLKGYSNVRNACLIAAQLLSADIAILIDDDEVFQEKEFLLKATEYMNEEIKGERVLAKAGYYMNPNGSYLINQEREPWMTYWNKAGIMNQAFSQVIGQPPTIKKTPFVFGGNLVVHKDLFSKIPFDPHITRGEDIDFLINVKMFGYPFFLDNQLAIHHYPPPKSHPLWCQLREDIYRFIYERKKLRSQSPQEGMVKLKVQDLDPYPGAFLKDDLNELIFKSNQMLALKYLQVGDIEGSQQCQRNILLAETDALPRFNPFEKLLYLQKTWQKLMSFITEEVKDKEIIGEVLYPV